MPDPIQDLPFPLKGLDVTTEFQEQPPGTTPVGVNVRAFEPLKQRARGGTRPGIQKYIAEQIPEGTELIQHLDYIVDPTTDALTVNFHVPGEDWPENPLIPGQFYPPEGAGWQPNPNAHQPPKKGGSGSLAIIVSIVGEGEMGDGSGPICTLKFVSVTYTPGFADLGSPTTDVEYCDCDETVDVPINGHATDPATPADLESADSFVSWLFTQGIGNGVTAEVVANYDITDEGSC